MRIAIVSHAYVQSGYHDVLSSMARHSGIDLALITPQSYRFDLQASPSVFSMLDSHVRAYPIQIALARRQGTFVYGPKELSWALTDFRPDILLHEQEVYTLGAVQLATMAARRSIPLVMFAWENVHRVLSLPRKMIVRFILGRCAGIIAGSAGAARVHRDWGFEGPLAVIPQMGISKLNPSPKYGKRNGRRFRVSFAGRLVPEKGVDCLLRAVAGLCSQGLDLECAIAGNGPEAAKLASLAQTLGIGARVEFTGTLPIHRVREFLARADVLVLPSRRTRVWEEQFGRILVEAMAEATVTLGTETGAIPEVIGSRELLFAEDNHHQLAGILHRLMSDPERLRAHQSVLWQRAASLYTNDTLSDRRLQFLTEVFFGSANAQTRLQGNAAEALI